MAVILASIDAARTFRGSLEGWLREMDGRGEVIVVDASRDGTADAIEASFPAVRVLRQPPGRLAPELWRDGLEATEAPLVAFSTAQMVPGVGWRRAMLERLEETGAAAVGGPIDPPNEYVPGCWATYLHRYLQYLRPILNPERTEPAGDNAVYRRDRLDALESLWDGGFWEVEIHRALRARGERLVLAEDAVVAYQGGPIPSSWLGQRYAHARRYGASRARGLATASRVARIVAAPAVPAVLLKRIVAGLTARGQSPIDWLPALPYLFPLLAAWSLGEARGLGAGLLGTRRPKVVTSSPMTVD
jgi:hypothetical protein